MADPRTELPRCVAVVLAGGRGSRLGGVDKASVELAGRTLLARALDACVDADEVVVVGEPVPTERPVTFTREDPRFGGPVAGLLTGVEALSPGGGAPALVVLPVDMPHLDAAALRRLRVAAHEAAGVGGDGEDGKDGKDGKDGAVMVDGDGRRQPVLVLDRAALAAVAPDREERHGLALRVLLDRLRLREVPARGREARDVDTWGDLRDAACDDGPI